MPRAATLFTPVYAPDFERFCLQRESIERCGIDLDHVAVVNPHKDLALFKTVPHQNRLRILSSYDLLPPSYDRRLSVWKISRRDYRYWITGPGIHGWLFQQLLKLAAPKVVDTEAIVCLDADAFFVDRVSAEDFYCDDGRVHLYETTDDLDAEMAEWHAHSLRFLGLKVTQAKLYRYTHVPGPLHRGVLLDLQRLVEKIHGESWVDAIIKADRIMEYSTYGVYAREIDGLRRVCPVKPEMVLYYWWADQLGAFEAEFASQIARHHPKIVLMHSNIGRPVQSYRELVSTAWPKG